MAIVCRCDVGLLLDHRAIIDMDYSTCFVNTTRQKQDKNSITRGEEKTCQKFQCREELFDIRVPVMMDSQFAKWNQQNIELTSVGGLESLSKTKKRKRSFPVENDDLIELHKQVKHIIERALQQLSSLGIEKGVFFHPDDMPSLVTDNNVVARQASRIEGPGDSLVSFCEVAKQFAGQDDGVDTPLVLNQTEDPDNVFNRLIENRQPYCTIRHWLGGCYLIPAHCQFLMSDITRIRPLLRSKKKYDVIVLDPPWENKSVKRKKKYSWLSNENLRELPIPELANDGCLVIVWVTNNSRHQSFITEQLFPAWNTHYLCRWLWLKVTRLGKCITDLESSVKKPYETLLIGRVGANVKADSTPLPADRVIISTPCSTHSRKPPLRDVIKEYLPDNPECLEMFARNLQPHWTSWGNEVLKFQHVDYFRQ